MTSQLRKLVSKKKKRFAQEGFDLDLSYITDNVIAMGFPSDSVGGIYRNPRKEVIRMLDTYHEDQYKVYNLCSERTYNHAIFYGRVSDFPIDDHNVPTMPMIRQFCEDAEQWLHQDEDKVIAVHCKAGKGRTGLMICCWLIHSQTCATSREAIELFGKERTKDRKGVTIPSQRRYIRYYELLLQHQLDPRDLPPPGQIPVVFLTEVRTNVMPNYDKSGANMRILLSDRSGNELYADIAKFKDPKNPTGGLYFDCRSCPLKGDVRLLIFHKSTKILQLWFNTMFITRTQLTFRKHELDKANKDKTHIPNNFTLSMVVTLPIKNPYFADIQEGEADLSSDSSQPATDDDDEGSDNDENHNENHHHHNNVGDADEGEEHADDADDRERDAAAEASGNNRGRRGGSGIGSIVGNRPPKADKKKSKKEKKKEKEKDGGQDGGKEKEEKKRSRSLIKRFGRESENNVATKPRVENGDAVPSSKKWRLSLVAPTKIPKPRRRSSSLDESDSLMAAELGEFAPGQLIDAGILLGGLPYASSASDSTVVMKDGHIEHSHGKHYISNGHNKKEKKNKEKEKKAKNSNNKQSPKKRPLTASASDLRHSSGSDVISVHSGSGHIAIGVPMSARDPEPSSHDKTTTNPRKHSSPAAVRRDTSGSSPAQGSDQQKTPERRASGLTTLPALVAPAGSRRSPKGSGSAREAVDHVNTNGGSAGRRAGEAENEDDEGGRGEEEGEEIDGPTLAELEVEELGGDEDAKERESPGRRKVGLQANLRRLSVRLTNVPNIFSKSAGVKPVREREESSVVGGSAGQLSSSGTHGTPQQQGGSSIVVSSGSGGAGGGRDMINAAANAADYAQGDEKPPKKPKRSRRKSRLSVNFDNLKKLTGLSHPDQMEKKPKQQFSKHARFDDRRLSTSAPSLVYPLMTTASSSSSLPAIEPADLSSTPNKHLCAIYGDDYYEDLDLDLDLDAPSSDASSGSGSSSMADKAAAAFNQAAAAAGDFSSTPTTLSLSSSPSSFSSASSPLTSSSSFMSPHHHHHLQQQHHHHQQQLQARSKVSEIIDKWNAHGLKSREHHAEDALDVKRRGPGDRSEIAIRRFAAQGARGLANHNYSGLYGGSCNDLYTRSDPLLRSDDYYDTAGYSTSLPLDSVMAGMSMSTSPSSYSSLSCSMEGSLGESDEFAGAQSSRFRGWGKRQLTDPRRPRPRSLHAGEGTGNGDFERRFVSVDGTNPWMGTTQLSVSGGAASPGPRPVGKVYMAAKALEPDPAPPASAPLLSSSTSSISTSTSTSTTSSSLLSSSSLATASFGPKSPTAAAKPPQSMRERVRAVVEKPRSGSLASSQPPSLLPSLSSPGGLSSPRTASPRLSLSSSSSPSSSPSPSRPSSFASSSSVPINKKRAITVGLSDAKREGGGGGSGSKEPLSARADNSWITLNSATSNAAALSSHSHLMQGRGRQRALSISSAVVAPVNLRKATSSATLSGSSIAPRDLGPMHAAANSFSTPLADFRELRDRRTDNRAQLWARLKGGGGSSGGSHSSLLADVANETGPEGVILPLIGRKRSSNGIGSGGSGSEIRSARSGSTIHTSQSSIITASASASHSGGGSSDPQAFKKADEVSEAFRRTLESAPVPQVADDRRRKWSFMSPSGGGGGGSGIVSLAGRDREPTRKKTGGSIIGGFMGGGSGGGGGATQEEGASRGGRKGSWKAKLAPLIEVSSSNSSSSPVSPLGGRGASCVTLGTRHDGDSVSVVSPSFYTPPPTSPASSLSLSSPGSGSAAAPLASTLAANARRKRAEEDAGVGVEELRQMLREKEQEAEEARKVMEARQYEVRELKERLWEKLNFVEDPI